jgi:hypothetical protein
LNPEGGWIEEHKICAPASEGNKHGHGKRLVEGSNHYVLNRLCVASRRAIETTHGGRLFKKYRFKRRKK